MRIYRDNEAQAIIFDPSSVTAKFINVLSATANDDGTVTIHNVNVQDIDEIANIPYTDILKEDGSLAGGTVTEVVNYLNEMFVYDAGGSALGTKPVITSPLAVEVVEDEPIHHAITATGNPFAWIATGLPTGIYLNENSGKMYGSSLDVGLHAATIGVINVYGTTEATLNITVTGAGGWVDTYSTLFRDTGYRQYAEATTTAALLVGSTNPWTVSLWVHLADQDADYDLWSVGSNTTWVSIQALSTGKIQVYFKQNSTHALIVTAGSLAVATWYHVAVTNDGSNTPAGIKVYVNGAVQANTTVVNTVTGASGATGTFRIARAAGGNPNALYLNGYLDEFSFYGTALNGAAVTALYHGGDPVDLTGLGSFGSCHAYYRMGDGDTFPTLTDGSGGGLHDATLYNMTASSFVSFVP